MNPHAAAHTMNLPTLTSCNRRIRRATRGFTLPEVLLAGVLGAMLLTALSYATFEFAVGIHHLEVKAGIADEDDAILRQITRDIREAWWGEIVSDSHLRLFDEQGAATDYYLEDSNLMISRPNGDVGVAYQGASDLLFEQETALRRRDGAPIVADGTWYQRSSNAGWSFPFTVDGGGQLALAFAVPVLESQLPGGSTHDEQVTEVTGETLSIPLAFADGETPQSVTISIRESTGPGAAQPIGATLAEYTFDATSLPAAVWDEDKEDWQKPSSVSIDLGAVDGFQLGRGYTIVIAPSGDSQAVVKAYPHLGSWDVDEDMVGYLVNGATEWSDSTMIIVPFSLSGPYSVTTTDESQQVSRISVTLYPQNRPNQTRSASLLSQALSEDPWLGVVPGQEAP